MEGLLVAVAPFIGLLIAIWAVWHQSRDTHTSLGVQILRDLEKEFISGGTKRQCIRLATHYLRTKRRRPRSTAAFSRDSSVFDFFESVGLLLRRGVLDMEMVYSSFYYWFVPLWELAEPEVVAWRHAHDDSTYWRDCERMYDHLVKHDARQRGIAVMKKTPAEQAIFLKELSE